MSKRNFDFPIQPQASTDSKTCREVDTGKRDVRQRSGERTLLPSRPHHYVILVQTRNEANTVAKLPRIANDHAEKQIVTWNLRGDTQNINEDCGERTLLSFWLLHYAIFVSVRCADDRCVKKQALLYNHYYHGIEQYGYKSS